CFQSIGASLQFNALRQFKVQVFNVNFQVSRILETSKFHSGADHRKALRCTAPRNPDRLIPWLGERAGLWTTRIEPFVSRMNAWVTSTSIRKWSARSVESGKFYRSLTLSLPVTKTLQFMYTIATIRAARLGRSI